MLSSLLLASLAILEIYGFPSVPSKNLTGEGSTTTPAANDTASLKPGALSAALSGFTQQCPVWGGTFGNDLNGHGIAILSASCFNDNGGVVTSKLDLNTCVENCDGGPLCQTG